MLPAALPPPPPGMGAASPSLPSPGARVINIGGLLPVMNAQAVLDQRRRANDLAYEAQRAPVLDGLAAHIKAQFHDAEEARQLVEDEMIEATYCRRGQYTPEKAAKIQADKQPLIYMMLGAAKMRQVEALLRDALLGTGADKPWTLRPTPVPDLPPSEVNPIAQALEQEVQQAMMMGLMPSLDDARRRLRDMKDQVIARINEEARVRAERMEQKMEDQLVEGGFIKALDELITDISTFKTAFLGGPFVRRKKRLSWGDDNEMQVVDELTLEWERIDWAEIYPARHAATIHDGPLIRRRRMSRLALTELIGVEGYSEPAIRKVLEQFGTQGYSDWLSIDSQKEAAEGKQPQISSYKGLISSLHYWGSASGQMLLDWGMKPEEVEDPEKEYQIEAIVVGGIVIKAVLNADPLARRPIYAVSFQPVPGSVWGNSPYDLLKDCQDMCNGAARALAANLGIASGPQVAIISNRLPSDEEVTDMFPWKIWQFESDPMGSTADPIKFFQPQSNAAELMQVYARFSDLADEYTGIPKYTTGLEAAGGAGRTASGMSMMLGNASKIIKAVVGLVDVNITTPILERLYYYNMRYGDDPDLKGDVRVVARGALSLVTKETAQVRTNELLTATANPIDMQIIGAEGRAELLRHAFRRLDFNPERIVPPVSVLKQRAAAMAMQQQQMAVAGPGGTPPNPEQNGQRLQNNAPVTDNFSPQGAPA